MVYSLPGSSAHGDSPGFGMGYHALLQGIFLTQGLNLDLSCTAGRLFTVWVKPNYVDTKALIMNPNI